ncbi:MAG: RluA family pseudouridine synthase [Pseudomonadales bacterium]
MKDPKNDAHALAILPATSEPYQLVHCGDDFVVVEKPAKLLSVPGRHPENRDCLVSRVQQQFPTACIVHRLDYDTSGLVVLPLNKPALSHISKQFQARSVKKAYTAVVDGVLDKDEGVIELGIAKDPDNPRCYKVCEEGKPSKTHYRVLERDLVTHTTRVLLEPVTGRSHQLRLHMKALGHCILGDEFYATAAALAASSRLMLHAQRISFIQPGSETLLALEIEVPF